MTPPQMPDNFKTIIIDFANDLTLTFPEYAHLWNKWTSAETASTEEYQTLFQYSLTIYPERFFDILYQNEEIFATIATNDTAENNTFQITANTNFLPDVDFKILYHCENVSENTQKTIWKYLQLILFTVLGSIKNKTNFGETMNLFDGVDENELQTKLQETIEGMNDFFANMENHCDVDNDNNDQPQEYNINDDPMNNNHHENMKTTMPKPEELHEHLKGLFDGKIGKFAKELAEEITNDITGLFGGEEETHNIRSTQDVIKKLMKNPKKMMDLVKTVSNKLNKKMESGEITQEDLMKEAGEIFGKMKDMGGQTQFNEMFKNLAKQMGGAGGKNAKFDMNAMSNAMKKNATKDKMKERLNQRKMASSSSPAPTAPYTVQQKDNKTFVFKMNDNENQQTEHSYINGCEKDQIEKIMKEFNLTEPTASPTSTTKKNNKKSKKTKSST